MGGGAGLDRLPFPQIWAVDFEFISRPGERPGPVCLVACELRSGELIRVWQDDLRRLHAPPYPTDSSALFVAYLASAELGCHLALGWSMPERILDLYAEQKAATNGRQGYGRQAWPDNYCGQNPLDSIARAARALVEHLKPR
jgi:hypothetical protein